MKKKQFMSKLAALTMAAAMGLTAVPATAVFAQTVSVDASYAGETVKADDAAKASASTKVDATAYVNEAKERISKLTPDDLTDDTQTAAKNSFNTLAYTTVSTDLLYNASYTFTAPTENVDGFTDGTTHTLTGTVTITKPAARNGNDVNKDTLDTVNIKMPVTITWGSDKKVTKVEAGDATVAEVKVYQNGDASESATKAASLLAKIATNDASTPIPADLNARLGGDVDGFVVNNVTTNDNKYDVTFTNAGKIFVITTDKHDGRVNATGAGTATVKADDSTKTTLEGDLQNAAKAYATDTTSKQVVPTKDIIADGIQHYLPATEDLTISDVTTEADGANTKVKATAVISKGSTEETYTVEFSIKAADLTNAEKMATIKDTVQKALNNHTFAYADNETTENEVTKVVNDALATLPDSVLHSWNKDAVSKDRVTFTVSVDPDKSVDSDENTKGTVVGSVTLNFKAGQKGTDGSTTFNGGTYPGEAAISEKVDFSAKRDYANETLTTKMAKDVVDNYLSTAKFQNDADAATIAARVNAYLNSTTALKKQYAGITASVSEPARRETSEHGKAAGTFKSTLTLSNGSRTVSYDFTGKYIHADQEKLDEVDKAVTAKAPEYKTTSVQKANATKAASKDDVKNAVVEIINKALDEKINDKDLSVDGWKDITAADVTVTEPATSHGVTPGTWELSLPTTDKGPQSIKAAVYYTAATPTTEGTAVVSVTSTIVDHENEAVKTLTGDYTVATKDSEKDAITKTTKFTLTFGKLKGKEASYLRFTKGSFTKMYDTLLPDFESGTDENTDEDNTYNIKDLVDTDGNYGYTWSTSDPDVVTVDQDGNITLKKVGEATITVTDKNKATLSAFIKVNAAQKYVFSDVQDSKTYYFNAVKKAVKNGVTAGVSKNEFGVNTPVTRGQFVTWLYRAAGEPEVTAASDFSDVASNAYYAKAVAWGVQNGIVKGTSATTFSPEQIVTRAQAVSFLYRTYAKKGSHYGTAYAKFDDVKSTDYYADAVAWAVDRDVTKGTSATTFSPKDDCTRAEGITLWSNADDAWSKLD
jgi:hypothetical protein